ncbi:MAG: hypothetical protein IMW89_03520 [Ktedonobacteraceae bacterium]|nr:hypothetical protein [Ktedonobacteraceae bacterium]
MWKKVIVLLAALAVFTLLLGSCAVTSAPTSSGPTVHMGQTDFIEHSVTLHKGDKLTLQDNVNSTHIITNGSWVNGSPQPKTEAGAPTVNVTINSSGESTAIGPFTTAGTFHLYCTVHPEMNLTVVVQ